jgi:hypothetical protein
MRETMLSSYVCVCWRHCPQRNERGIAVGTNRTTRTEERGSLAVIMVWLWIFFGGNVLKYQNTVRRTDYTQYAILESQM